MLAVGIVALALAGCSTSTPATRTSATIPTSPAAATAPARGRQAANWDVDGDGRRDRARLVYLGGYGPDNWGLTASYSVVGYAAHAPDLRDDLGVISPTAAISSFPYTPRQSMAAIRHWYEQLHGKLWGKYGFYDAFSEKTAWYPPRYLAIDQGPEAVMIENYRSGLLWRLFMSCPEVQAGLKKLGFTSPWIK